jgi:hypothetical protein
MDHILQAKDFLANKLAKSLNNITIDDFSTDGFSVSNMTAYVVQLPKVYMYYDDGFNIEGDVPITILAENLKYKYSFMRISGQAEFLYRNVKTHCRIRIVDGEIVTKTQVEIQGNMSARIYSNLDINISKRVSALLNDSFREDVKKRIDDNIYSRFKNRHDTDMKDCQTSN